MLFRSEFHRVGDTERRAADFRLIAATNLSRRSLQEALLPDFYDRIADFIIEMPALRDCPADLSAIWELTARNTCSEIATTLRNAPGAAAAMTAALSSASGTIVEKLKHLQLDGNWRDLQRLARRLLARSLGEAAVQDVVVARSAVDDELSQLVIQESLAGPARGDGSLLDALPDIESCRAAMLHANATATVVPYNQLTGVWQNRLIEAAVAAVGSERAAAQLLGLPQKTLNNARKRLKNPE